MMVNTRGGQTQKRKRKRRAKRRRRRTKGATVPHVLLTLEAQKRPGRGLVFQANRAPAAVGSWNCAVWIAAAQ